MGANAENRCGKVRQRQSSLITSPGFLKMNSDNSPTIAIVSLTYNDGKILGDCLESIKKQTYPRDKVQVLFVDGGSTDNTMEIIHRYGAGVINAPELVHRPDLRVETAMSAPKTDMVLFISADCRLQENDCLQKMVDSLSQSDIVGVQTQRYGFSPKDPILSRYLSLVGGVDPVAVGLGKADRTPHDRAGWHSGGAVMDRGDRYEIVFSGDPSEMPAIGANGFMIKREYLEKAGGMRGGAHVDMCVRLIRQGYNKFAFLKDRYIVHYIDIPLLPFLRRRLTFAGYYEPEKVERIYKVFSARDWPKLLWVVITYSTLLIPLLRALRGYVRKPDLAWFLHPVVCFVFFCGYSLYYSRKIFRRLAGCGQA